MIATDSFIGGARINARQDDAIDIFNFRHYIGPNPYLNRASITFDFSLTGNHEPLPLERYVEVISDRYPHLREEKYESYAHLFACTVVEVNKLDIDLHLNHWSVSPAVDAIQIAIESLHARTSRAVVYCVWDWFEAITQGEDFDLAGQIGILQDSFRQSIYGGPTVYALLRAAHEQSIPAFYLWDERLMQYGYGKHQVRGIATTFDIDSHIDSDFTTYKDDCKILLDSLGFPVPQGEVVTSLRGALGVADQIGYPVAVKPVSGHKGEGVTADVQDEDELEEAYERAVLTIPDYQPVRVIVEQSIRGKDYRILCVAGRFVAATERCPAYVVGDGRATIQELIERENRSALRSDTPTSPLGKIKTDEAMDNYLQTQGLSQESVIDRDRIVYLRKVANLSSGGLSIDATRIIHPDNIILAQDVAQHFRLTCLGIDVVAQDLSKSWKDGHFSIIEINAAPGISMHLKPAIGEPVDVPALILKTFFESGVKARIPIITLNRVSVPCLHEMIDYLLQRCPDWTIGAVCRDGVFVNRSEKVLNSDYNKNILNLLRNPKLDLLIAEYDEAILEEEGMFYYGSDLVILDNPTDVEMMLARDVFEGSTVVIQQDQSVTIRRQGLLEQYELGEHEPFKQAYLKELSTLL